MTAAVAGANASRATTRAEVYDELAIACLVLIGVLILAAIGVYVVRRWVRDAPQASAAEPLTLEHLRSLHRQGQLTDEEFETAKARMIARMTGRSPAGEVLQEPGGDGENLPPEERTSSS